MANSSSKILAESALQRRYLKLFGIIQFSHLLCIWYLKVSETNILKVPFISPESTDVSHVQLVVSWFAGSWSLHIQGNPVIAKGMSSGDMSRINLSNVKHPPDTGEYKKHTLLKPCMQF